MTDIPPTNVDTGAVRNAQVVFPPWRAPADTPSPPPPAPLPPERRLGVAVVGLGRLSLEEILPVLATCTHARLAAIVSGSAEKRELVAAQYGVPPNAVLDYAGFDRIGDVPGVDIVYIVLPNAMHRAFVERAARAGKHVLCEKPMAMGPDDAVAMRRACDDAGVKLMVAYRIHYQNHHRRLRALVAEQRFGRLVGMTLTNVQTVAADGDRQWRHKAAMAGGGALPDIGLYLVNTACFLTGEAPETVWATSYSPVDDARFAEVEETVAFTLRFPSGIIAQCLTSYGARDDKHARLNFAAATVDMANAFSYGGQRMTIVTRESDHTSRNEVVLPEQNQFAAEIDHFARCIQEDRSPSTDGAMGERDHRIMDAIYRSARTGQPVRLQEM
jgi:predicted dehydrogenase